MELEPDAASLDNLALVYYKLERYQEALDHFNIALSLDPEQAASYRGRGDVHQAMGSYQAALDDFQKYLQLRPGASDRQDIEEKIAWLQGQIG